MEFSIFVSRADEINHLNDDDTSLLQEHTVSLFEEILESEDDSGTETLAAVARFIQGDVFPGWNQTKLDVGPKFVYEAIARCAGENITADDVEEKVGFVGDVGDVAASYEFGDQQNLLAFSNDNNATLSITEIGDELYRLAQTSGEGSQKQKSDILFGLLNRCSPDEARYLTRLVLSEMHLGITEKIVFDSLASMLDVSSSSIQIAMQVTNDYQEVIDIALEGGDAALQTVTVELGRPIQPMLAETGDIRGSVEAGNQVAVEIKHDGARAQIHYDGGDRIRIYSRNMEDVTQALPDVVQYVKQNIDTPVILDGEVVAVDENGVRQPFQNVLRRFRQQGDVHALRNQFPVQYHPFDCLYYDGEGLLEEPLVERYGELWKVYPHERVPKQRRYSSTDGIADFESEALKEGYEGIIVKQADSTYHPGERAAAWKKVKPDVETLDVAITGGEWVSDSQDRVLDSFLVGVQTDRGFKTVGNIASGVSDEELERLTSMLKPYIRSETGNAIDIQPSIVVEVGYEEIQESPKYTSQYALRYPRFIGVREDKDVGNTDSLARVRDLAEQHATSTEDEDEESRERVKAPGEESDSVKVVDMGDEDVKVVDREDSEAAAEDDDDDDDDDDDSSERIYAG